MSYNTEEIKKMMANELKREDSFEFECKMCGNCCRNREEPILLTGPDVFRIAVALKKSLCEVLLEYTKADIGEASHVPIVYLSDTNRPYVEQVQENRERFQNDYRRFL